MKYCIVNADDFGMSRGVNRGIVEAHQSGIVTSTSLMVTMPASAEAALLSRETPELSVGLHVNLTGESPDPIAALSARGDHGTEIERQLSVFEQLMGCLPTHIDSHQNVHRYPQLLPLFQDLANRYGLPLREYSRARYFPDFYGQWDGETHLEQVSPGSLLRMLEAEFHEGITELSCHPGYVDADFHSFYAREREEELRTLCNPSIRDKLSELGIKLISFRELQSCR
jgi:chitin disaccharide deacetylase